MIKVIIIDDEQLAIDNLTYILRDFKDIEIVATFTDSLNLLDYLKTNTADLIFMDIEMPEITGLELASMVSENNKDIGIVFATAYDQYAIKAFDVSAVDYILKPLSKSRVEKTVDKVIKRINGIVKGASKPNVQIKCLGGFEIFIDGKQIPFKVSKAKELLAYLINAQGKSLGWMTIADDLWPDTFDDKKLMNNFHVASYSLRTFLTEKNIIEIFDYSRNLYRVDVTKFECDFIKLHEVYNEYRKTKQVTIPPAIFDTGEYLEGQPYTWSLAMADKVDGMVSELLAAHKKK